MLRLPNLVLVLQLPNLRLAPGPAEKNQAACRQGRKQEREYLPMERARVAKRQTLS